MRNSGTPWTRSAVTAVPSWLQDALARMARFAISLICFSRHRLPTCFDLYPARSFAKTFLPPYCVEVGDEAVAEGPVPMAVAEIRRAQ